MKKTIQKNQYRIKHFRMLARICSKNPKKLRLVDRSVPNSLWCVHFQERFGTKWKTVKQISWPIGCVNINVIENTMGVK